MKTLTAKEGMVLTNQDHSIMGKSLYLPDSNTDEFTEITEQEYATIRKEARKHKHQKH